MIKNILVVISFCLLPLSSQAMDLPAHESVIGFNSAFVPGGFDSTSDVYTVVSGIFPNSCYSWKDARVNHMDSNLIEITGLANVTQGMCMMVLIPFQREVWIGQLNAGQYTLRFNNGDGTHFEQLLTIEQ
jgi:hypothetical protein